MYKEEKKHLRKIVRMKGCEKKIYDRLAEEAEKLDAVERKRVYQELKRDYEIGAPIDKIYEVLTISISCLSLMVSGCAFASKGNGESWLVIFLGAVLAIFVVILIVYMLILYERKRELMRLVDFFKELLETEER